MLLIGAVAFVATAAVALFIPWLPDQVSREREGIDLTFWLATWICIGIFAVVAAVIGYSFLKFRVRPDDDSDGPPIHGHTGLEIAWTAIPLVLVTAIAIVSTVALARSERLPDDHMTVDVLAQQFTWQFTYPDQGDLASATLRLPV